MFQVVLANLMKVRSSDAVVRGPSKGMSSTRLGDRNIEAVLNRGSLGLPALASRRPKIL